MNRPRPLLYLLWRYTAVQKREIRRLERELKVAQSTLAATRHLQTGAK